MWMTSLSGTELHPRRTPARQPESDSAAPSWTRPGNQTEESLADVTGKYKEAMVYIAQLDKENRNLVYEVDNLKDIIEEMEEKISEYHKEHENNSKEFHILQITLEEFKKSLHYRDELLLKHGIVPEDTPSYAIAQEIKVGMRHLVSQEDKVQRLEPAGDTEQGHTF
ncbi:leucine-rich repeat flightless-interacting protein 2-like isoform X2 [Pseudophryne corroboree]|uniref:leucine-rich repeat flightless-interacting protein 2-like isoform X2 n=1 Tax=Pseudophryne corroboree TaxID=495146 RepID=UPI0030821D08